MNTLIPARLARTTLALAALATAAPAAAYVGPGAGLSLLGALWAVVATVATALFFLLMWPLRRLFRRGAGRAGSATPTEAPVRRADGPALPPGRGA